MNGYCKTMLQAITDIEKNLAIVKKTTLAGMVNGFLKLEKYLQRGEEGIFEIALKWCRLFVDIQAAINPKRSKLLEQYGNLASTAITYIIRYLQYTNDIPNYHYTLLEILDTLLENLPPSVLKSCDNFETGTIACLWKPITYGVDYKTQELALKSFSTLLKYIDESKWSLEFRAIKCRKFKIFKDDLSDVIRETTRQAMFEKTSRKLLNNFNEHVLNNSKIFSFNCNFISIGEKYEVFKCSNTDTFWIDLNCTAQSISFEGRFRAQSDAKYGNVNGKFKIQHIKIESGAVLIQFEDSNIDSFPIATSETMLKMHLLPEEEKRIQQNNVLSEFLKKFLQVESTCSAFVNATNNIPRNEDAVDRLRNDTLENSEAIINASNNFPDNEDTFDRLRNDTLENAETIIDATNNSAGNEDAFDRLRNDTLGNSEDNKNKPVSKTKRRSYLHIFDSPPTPNKDKTIYNSNKSNNSSLNIFSDVTSSPVSTRCNRTGKNTKHPIRQLCTKRGRCFGEDDDDEDYVPNKFSKKRKKNNNSKNGKKSEVQKKANVAIDFIEIEDSPQHSNTNNNIINVTKKLRHGKECDILDNEVVGRQHAISNDKDAEEPENTNVAVNMECSDFQIFENVLSGLHIRDSLCGPQSQTPQPALKSILKKRSKNECVKSNAEKNYKSPSNNPNDSSEDYPHLRFPKSPQNCMIHIKSPQPMPQTPSPVVMMNISDISNDISIENDGNALHLEHIQQCTENYNELQQIIDDWPKEDDSDMEGFANINNDHSDCVNNSDKNNCTKENQSEKESQLITEDNNEVVQNSPRGSNENTKSTKTSTLKWKRKKNNRFPAFKWRSPKIINHNDSKVYLGIRSRKVVSLRIEESTIVQSDDECLDSIEGNSSLVFNTTGTGDLCEENFSKQISEYKSKIENNLKLLRRSLNCASEEVNKQKVCEITQRIVRESQEQRNEIQQRLQNLERMRVQMEVQWQMYAQQCKKIERFQKNAEQLLNALNERSTGIIKTAGITNECEELIKQFNGIEDDIHLETWKN